MARRACSRSTRPAYRHTVVTGRRRGAQRLGPGPHRPGPRRVRAGPRARCRGSARGAGSRPLGSRAPASRSRSRRPGALAGHGGAGGPGGDGNAGDEAPGRRRGIDHALALLGLGPARRREEQAIREEAERSFGRLYWLLTITAWVCAGVMVMVVVLPMFGGFAGASPLVRHNPLAWIGVLCTLGLGAGLGAWWLARRMR